MEWKPTTESIEDKLFKLKKKWTKGKTKHGRRIRRRTARIYYTR